MVIDLVIDIPRITAEELYELLERPDTVILDVRSRQNWDASETMIEGAVTEDPDHPERWLDRYPRDRSLVLYCASPDEAISEKVARTLVEHGYSKVRVLQGGWQGWIGGGYPTVPQ